MASKKHKVLHERIFIPCASFTPERIAIYTRPIDGWHRTGRFTANQFNLEDNDHEGLLSKKSRRKIERALTWLLFKAQPKTHVSEKSGKKFSFKINFVTLTLPAKQVHSDNEIKDRCLNNFLTVLRKYGCNNYLWRAEAQPSTNNIHFHITTDTYLPHMLIRKWWNQSLNLLGYLDAFALKHKHRNPNSTDVHSVKHVKKLAAYLSKYLGKNVSFPCIGELRTKDGKQFEILYSSQEYKNEPAGKKQGKIIGHVLGARVRPINGRLWGCSSSLSACKSVILDGEVYSFGVVEEFIAQSDFKVKVLDHVTLAFGDIAGVSKKWFPQLYNALVKESNADHSGFAECSSYPQHSN